MGENNATGNPWPAAVQRATAQRLAALVVLVGISTGCTRRPADPEVLGTLERDRLELVAEAHEPITEILVREGDRVATGQDLLRQELGATQARLDQGRAGVEQAEHRLQELVHGPRTQEVLEARAALDSAQSAAIVASREYQRNRDLQERKLVSQSAVDQAKAQRDSAQGIRDQTNARLKLLLEGTRIEELDQARAALQAAQAALRESALSAARFTVVAPQAGVVEALPYKVGERPPAGSPLVILLGEGRVYARVYVPEPLRARYAAGTAVQIHVDGVDRWFDGKVRYVAAQASFTPYFALSQKDRSRLSYLAEVDLNESGPNANAGAGGNTRLLPSGVPVQARIGAAQ